MKFKRKSLILGSTAIIGLCPTVSLLMSSCHKEVTFDDTINNIKNTILSEFQWICKYYRKTFCSRFFCNELAKRVRGMGFNVVKDWDEENDRPYNDDDPLHPGPHYRPDVNTAYGYDMYFDIPAHGKKQDYPTIVIQAHTDMVCVVVDDEQTHKPIPYDWSKGVIPVYDKDDAGRLIIHSQGYKTTLGADDGAGVATILAFARHWKEFEHGKIRCIFTVDEEDGESGAKYIPKEWLQNIDYYLSLDGENSHINWNYSAGAEQVKYVLTEQNNPVKGDQQFHIVIGGLEGGHSGLAVHENHLHPLIVMGFVLQHLAGTTGVTDVRIVKCWDNSDPKETPNGGSIPKGVTFDVQISGTTKTAHDITGIVGDAVLEAKSKPYQGRPEDVPTVVVEEKTGADILSTGLTKETTTQLANFLTDYYNNKIYYYKYEGEEEGQKTSDFVEVGSGIGAVRVGDEVKAPVPGPTQKNTLYMEFFGRSTKTEKLNKFLDEDIKAGTRNGIYYKAIDNAFQGRTADGQLTRLAYNLPWIKNDDDSMQKLIHEASRHYNNILINEPVFGWLEIAEAYAKNDKCHYGIIGPQIYDLHKPNERIIVDSIALMNKLVIYIMQHLS